MGGARRAPAGRGARVTHARLAWLALACVALLPAAADAAPPLPAVSAAPDDDPISVVLEGARAALHRCYEKGAADDYRLAGELLLRLELAEGGAVRGVEFLRDSVGDAALAACVKMLAASWTFAGLSSSALELPLRFDSPGWQHTVRVEDATRHGDRKSALRVLLDGASVAADRASLLLLELGPRRDVPLHRHTSAEVIFLLEGEGRVRDLSGGKGHKLRAGDAVYVPAGVAHGLTATCCKRSPSRFLVLYAPAGPERAIVDPAARGDGATTMLAKAERTPDRSAPVPRVVGGESVPALPILGGKGAARILFDAAASGDREAALTRLSLDAEAVVPEHVHAGAAELLFVLAGRGTMTIAGRHVPIEPGMAVYIPPDTPHSFRCDSKLDAVQFYTPAGAEQRFRR